MNSIFGFWLVQKKILENSCNRQISISAIRRPQKKVFFFQFWTSYMDRSALWIDCNSHFEGGQNQDFDQLWDSISRKWFGRKFWKFLSGLNAFLANAKNHHSVEKIFLHHLLKKNSKIVRFFFEIFTSGGRKIFRRKHRFRAFPGMP